MHAARSRQRHAAASLAAVLLVAGLGSSAPPARAAAAPAPGTITTWAGGTGEGQATNLAVRPDELAARGPFVYLADERHHTVRVLDTRTGELRTVAGTGDPAIYLEQTPRGDGGPATASRLDTVSGVAVDAAGRVSLSDFRDNRVRRVDDAGIITTIAGGGSPSDGTGDGLPATQASLSSVASLAFDPSGNLFAIDSGARVRKISTTGIVTTVAGTRGYTNDEPENVLATLAEIHPLAVAVDGTGHLHIATRFQVLKIDDDGVLRRVVGTPESQVDRGDGGPATEATLRVPEAIAFDGAGNLYIADSVDDRVRMVDLAGTITTIVGGGSPSDGLGDGGLATAASLDNPTGVVVGPRGELYVADTDHYRLRKVSGGVITTAAGNGTPFTGGDGGPAAMAQLRAPMGMARDGSGNQYVADTGNDRVRRIDPSGRVTTVAGSTWGFSGDGGPAVAAQLHHPEAVAVDSAGNLFISDSWNYRVRKVDPAGIITTVAGGGTADVGDGGPATDVRLLPSGLAVDGVGNLYVADSRLDRVRKVTPAGTISTFAGGGPKPAGGGVGDGGPATSAVFSTFSTGRAHLAFDPLGQLHISAWDRVRKIDLAGVITTVVGTGTSLGVGAVDGSPALKISLTNAGPIAFDGGGNLLLAAGVDAIVRFDLMGRARPVGGTSSRGPLGDGGPATKARIDGIGGLDVDRAGNVYVAHGGGDRIRRIEAALVPSRVLATGWNGLGQLGDGSKVDRVSLVGVVGLSDVRAVAGGYYHSLAVKSDGTVWAWGWNVYGQLGDGTTTDRAVPTRVPGLTNVVAVAGGAYHSLALKADGTVWAWGWNGLGQLGDGTTTDRHTPVRIPGLTGVKAIASGGYHDLALTHGGTVFAWGWNYFGQLGTGSAAASESRPVPVPGSAGATAIAAGAVHSLAVRPTAGNDAVWSWGFNGLGQLGDGTTTGRRAPVQSLAYGSEVFAGGYHSFVAGSSFFAWGYNAFGQLGTGSTATYVATPDYVTTPASLDSIAPGLFHNVALAQNGSVLSWGWNGYGALGDGTRALRSVPTGVPGITAAGVVAVGAVHSIVVR